MSKISLKSNILLNVLNTLTRVAFPIVTFPYAARVLLPEGIGIVNFHQSIVNYLLTLTAIGIPIFGIREIARRRDNIKERNKLAVELMLLNLSLCVLGYIAVVVLGVFVPRIHENQMVLYILSINLFFSAIGVEWFFQGIENFRYITIRAIAFRILTAVCLFVFVTNRSDVIPYAWIMLLGTSGNFVINFIYLRKYIDFSKIEWHKLKVFRHMLPCLHVFVLNLAISIYTNLNSVMLGFYANDTSVGYYTSSMKIVNVVTAIVYSITFVMIPRCSHLYETGQLEQFRNVSRKAYLLVISLSLPACAMLIAAAHPLIMLFCGGKYEPSVQLLLITSPAVVFIGITGILGMQVLYSQGRINTVILSCSIAAVLAIAINAILMPRMSHTAAAITTFCAELAVLIVQIVAGNKYIPFKLINRQVLKYLAISILVGVSAWLSQRFLPGSNLTKLCAAAAAGFFVYVASMIATKDAVAMATIDYVKKLSNR